MKKLSSRRKKLRLSRQAIRRLDTNKLERIVGAATLGGCSGQGGTIPCSDTCEGVC